MHGKCCFNKCNVLVISVLSSAKSCFQILNTEQHQERRGKNQSALAKQYLIFYGCLSFTNNEKIRLFCCFFFSQNPEFSKGLKTQFRTSINNKYH